MPTYGETHPDDLDLTCPTWGEWLDDRHVAVQCKACNVVYCRRTWGTTFRGGKMVEGWREGVPTKCKVCADRAKEEKRKTLPVNPVLVAAVQAHASANYGKDGWDFIVESYTTAELWEVIAGAKDVAGAIKKAHAVARLLREREQDCRA